MFGSISVRTIEGRLAELVHERVRRDATERERHARFIVSRILMGAAALVLAPIYLALRGPASPQEYLALVFLAAPLIAGVTLSRTGRLALAHAISAAGFAGLVACVASASGGLASAATIWLVAVPLEALVSGSKRAAVSATFIAGLAVIALAILDLLGVPAQVDPWPAALSAPIFALFAIAHAGSLVLAVSRARDAQADAIRRRDARDRSLLQVMDDLVVWHDAHGHVLSASPAAMKLVGAPSGALEERGLFSRVHVQDRPAYLKALGDAASGGVPVTAQFRLHFGDALAGEAGRVVWVEMRAYRVETADDKAKLVSILRDVTAQKSHECDLERARLEAERAGAMKARFLATVSHELRTPLNAIIGFSEILSTETMAGVGPDQRRSYAKIIHDSGHHLLEVVNSLLDMSQIESGNFEFAPAPFDIAPLVQGCVDLMRLKAQAAGIALEASVEAGLPELVADRRACRQILINLVSNAVKFTPKGGRVHVVVKRRAGMMALVVSDTGIGVPEAALAKLGDPFFQVNAAYDRPHEGTGLGLSVVRGLVGLHEGTLAIESAPGEGMIVTVELPIAGRPARAVGETKAHAAAPIPITVRARRRAPAALELETANEVTAPREGGGNEEFKRSA
ncbi:sensor histidine kinase [Salinarimonas ramus]|uniref:histidine kinase n=1 Tax=Salinarimonas ramus TaxID=690164 RepID=A0A917Q971_9HYPH|nr:PAS domain-containing sensor histidine kinase [Salinarimonas ramus]GGK36349.1 PAS domain-containing sensor histidine kinase [Salinarimonas ramus]